MKTHLLVPDSKVHTMCGKFNVLAVDDPDEIDCQTCLGLVADNLEWYHEKLRQFKNGKCANCGNEILMAIFKGGLYCCENCRKALIAKGALEDEP